MQAEIVRVPPQVENFLLPSGEPDTVGDTFKPKRIEPVESMRMRPQVTARGNVTESAGARYLVPLRNIGTTGIDIRVQQPRGACGYALPGLARQAAVHPRRFIPAIGGDSMFLQRV